MERRKDNKGRALKDGEGQRKDGLYQYRYTDNCGERHTIYSWRLIESDPYPLGKKKTLSLREKEKDIERQYMLQMQPTSMTVMDIFNIWIRIKKDVRDTTKAHYIQLMNKHIKPTIGDMCIKDVKKNNILQLYSNLSEKIGNGTIQGIHSILNAIFSNAVDNDYILKNPTRGCINDYPYYMQNKRDSLTEQQQNDFIKFMHEDKVYRRYYEIAELILQTGLRRGEVLGLTWRDIDFKNRVISVNHQLLYSESTKGKYTFYIDKPKSIAGCRMIPMTTTAESLLLRMRGQACFNGINIDGYSNFLFLNSQGNNVIIPRQLSDSLKQAVEKYNKNHDAKLPNIDAHTLRHTACTRFAEGDMDIKVLQYIMGHQKAETTMNIYNHVNEDRIKRAMIEFERIV